MAWRRPPQRESCGGRDLGRGRASSSESCRRGGAAGRGCRTRSARAEGDPLAGVGGRADARPSSCIHHASVERRRSRDQCPHDGRRRSVNSRPQVPACEDWYSGSVFMPGSANVASERLRGRARRRRGDVVRPLARRPARPHPAPGRRPGRRRERLPRRPRPAVRPAHRHVRGLQRPRRRRRPSTPDASSSSTCSSSPTPGSGPARGGDDADASAFIGVPIRIHDFVFGNLYLIGKRDGLGFTREDEEVAQAIGVGCRGRDRERPPARERRASSGCGSRPPRDHDRAAVAHLPQLGAAARRRPGPARGRRRLRGGPDAERRRATLVVEAVSGCRRRHPRQAVDAAGQPGGRRPGWARRSSSPTPSSSPLPTRTRRRRGPISAR